VVLRNGGRRQELLEAVFGVQGELNRQRIKLIQKRGRGDEIKTCLVLMQSTNLIVTNTGPEASRGENSGKHRLNEMKMEIL